MKKAISYQRSAISQIKQPNQPKAESRSRVGRDAVPGNLRACPAFTLIEILTVITIIGILAALLLPAIGAATNKAKTARARTMVQHTGAAFRAYFAENSVWPTNSSYSGDPFPLMTNVFKNSASITFLDVSPKDLGTFTISSVTYTGVVVDPWKRPYWCRVDSAYAGYVANPFSGGANITVGYAIWSDGKDGAYDTGAAQDVGVNKDNIRSW